MRIFSLFLVLGMVFGCSDDNGISPDQGGVPDQMMVDSSADGPSQDGPASDGPTIDNAVADGPTPDGPVAADMGNVDGAGGCAQDSDCDLASNCCECNAYPKGQVPMCPLPCVNKTCVDSYMMTAPQAICASGKCVVADAVTCSSDADCQLVKDCCRCMVFAAGLATPPCSRNCKTDSCTAMGLPNATASCVAGKCRLVP